MITPVHLLLMVIGIIVLLGGVWAVSVVQSDGGGVDVGTWQEGADEIIDEVLDVPAVSSPVSPPTIAPSGRERGHVRSATSPASSTLERSAPFVPNLPPLPATPFPSVQSDGPTSPNSSQTFSPFRRTRPSNRRRFPSFAGQEGASGASTLLPGGGFSIGLSPISPGFALVPRRRVSGLGGPALAASEVPTRAGMRRTLSEGDVNEAGRHVDAGGVEAGAAGASRGDQAEGDPSGGARKSRWRWLKGVFLGR